MKKVKNKIIDNWFVLLFFICLLIINVLVLNEMGFDYSLNSDDASYIAAGINFKNTGSFTMHGVLSAQVMPGMTLLIGTISSIFGEGQIFLCALKLLWIIMGLITVFVVYKTINLYANKVISVISCIFFFSLDYIWMNNIILTETPFILLFSLLVYHTMKLAKNQENNKKDYYLIIIYFILALFIRPNIIPFPFIMVIYLILKKYNFSLIIKHCLITFFAVLILIVPWTIRNYKIFDTFIPLTYGAGNPLLLGTYQGVGFPSDEELDYKSNVDDKMSKEMKYYFENPDEKPHMTKYYSLLYDEMKAKYRMSKWWENDKVSMLESYLLYKPKFMIQSSFFWDELFGINENDLNMLRKIELVIFGASCIVILIDKRRLKELLFLGLLYLSQVVIYSCSFAFSRYAITLFFMRYIVIGIGIGIVWEKIKSKKLQYD